MLPFIYGFGTQKLGYVDSEGESTNYSIVLTSFTITTKST